MSRYPIRQVGTAVHREYWVPAEDLGDFNDHIAGTIDLVASFGDAHAPKRG